MRRPSSVLSLNYSASFTVTAPVLLYEYIRDKFILLTFITPDFKQTRKEIGAEDPKASAECPYRAVLKDDLILLTINSGKSRVINTFDGVIMVDSL